MRRLALVLAASGVLAACASAGRSAPPAAAPRAQQGGAGAAGQGAGQGPGQTPGGARGQDGLRPFAELVRGAVHRSGFFDTYQKGDHLYLVLPRDRLGRDFLFVATVAQGIGAGGLYGGTMLDRDVNIVALERRGEHRVAVLAAAAGAALAARHP